MRWRNLLVVLSALAMLTATSLPLAYSHDGRVQCSDGRDNADREDRLADADDPGCHTDGDPNNPDSYDPTDDNERNKPQCSDDRDNADPEDELADEADPGCHTDGDPDNPGSYNPRDNDETDPPECSDNRDNADPEDELADEADPGCHTDGDPNNPDSYDPNDDDETDVVQGNFTCRASAVRTENWEGLLTELNLEPVVANDENDPCVTDEDALLGDESNPIEVGPVSANALSAETTAADDSGSATAEVTQATATVSGVGTLTADVLTSSASATCENGEPVLDGSATVVAVTVDGTTIDPVGENFSVPIIDPITGVEVATLYLNYVDRDVENRTVTARALWLRTPGLPTVGDVIIAESIADYNGNPCAA